MQCGGGEIGFVLHKRVWICGNLGKIGKLGWAVGGEMARKNTPIGGENARKRAKN